MKAHVARLGGSGAKAAAMHLRYIQRDGVERDGSTGRLYTTDGPARAEAFEQPRVGEAHQFRFVVSPEDAGELDLTAFVRTFMARVERDLGRRLEWAAVNHYDTDHPHAHVVVRGVDREGREVRIDRGYIAQGMRWRAQELATEELGPRREVDVQRARTKEVTQARFTSLDRAIETRATEGHLEARTPARSGGIDESLLVARLAHLEGLGLAQRTGRASWALAPGWQAELRELGMRGDILKQMHKAVAGDAARYRVVREGQALDADAGPKEGVTRWGRVASKGLADEVRGRFFAVLETPSGDAYHVPLDARSAEALGVGDAVVFGTRPERLVRAVDRTIAQEAAAGGGVWDGLASAREVQAMEHRLRELERLGLVKREGAHGWRVPPDLLEKLEERQQREGPARHRLVLRKDAMPLEHQVRHRGPVALDRVNADALAPFGFGAEVRRLLERRREVLRELGVDPEDRRRFGPLREMERRAVGEAITARTGQAFIADAPDGFRGRVARAGPRIPDSDYALVSDGARFVVLRAGPALLGATGKDVVLARDARGQVVVRPAPDRDLGR